MPERRPYSLGPDGRGDPSSELPGKGGIKVIVQQPRLFRLDEFARQGGSHSFDASSTDLIVPNAGKLSETTNISVKTGISIPQAGLSESNQLSITSKVNYIGIPQASFIDRRSVNRFTQALKERGLNASVVARSRRYPDIFITDPEDPNIGLSISPSYYSFKSKADNYLLEGLRRDNPGLDTKKIRSIVSSQLTITMGRIIEKSQYDKHPSLYSLDAVNIPEKVAQYAKLYETVLNTLYEGFKQSPPDSQIVFRPPSAGRDTVEEVFYEETGRPRFSEGSAQEVTFDDVAGQEEAVTAAKRLILAMNQPELYERRGVKRPKGILFHGPPGTGKTLLARAIAHESGAEFLSIAATDIASKWWGEAEKLLQGVFDRANNLVLDGKPVIVFIDEADAIASSRSETSHDVKRRILSVLLQNMDGFNANPNVTIIAATNDKDSLDPAFIREGRMDKTIEFKELGTEAKIRVLEINMRKAQERASAPEDLFDPSIDLTRIAEEAKGLTGAAFANLINLVLENNLMSELEGNPWTPVTTEDVIALARSSTEPSAVRRFGFRTK